jgi:ribosomal protein S18 acetylase RimI-like enzyme
MTEVVVRPLALVDLPVVVEMDHSYHTDYVWQMDFQSQEQETKVSFREVRLPRSMRVEYPYDTTRLADEWKTRSIILVAEREEETVGYVSLSVGQSPGMIMVSDFAVLRRLRRHGIGAVLLRAAQTWSAEQNADRLVLEMQSKNYPAICLAYKLGFEFCGYNDRYYANQDIALFFAKRV